MAIKLTQGADSTIVTAATRAGLATSPKDYSGIFDSVSKSYDAATQASAEAWGQIAGTIAVVGAELQKKAEIYSDVEQRIFNAGGTQKLVDEVYDIKDELRALGSFGGKFGDRETRKDRAEILARRNKLFAEVDGWGESLEEASLAAKNGLLDYNLMGGDVEFVNAIIASNTSNKTTSEGNEARISRDPKTGELMYTLHDMNSGGAAIPGKTMSLSSFKTLIQDSAKDVDNVTGTFLTGVTDGSENMGATYGGAMDEYNKGKLLTSLDSMTSNAATLRRGMRTKFGHSGASFYDELTGPNQTELSSKYFTLMLEDIANTTINKETGKKEIKADALSEGLDANNDGSVSQQEINDKYVLFQNSILTGEGPMAKALFTDFVMNRAEEAYKFGAKQYNKKNPPGGKEGEKNLGIPDYTYPKFGSGKIDAYDARTLKRNLTGGIAFNFNPTGKKGDDRKYDFVDGQWYENYDFDKNEGTLVGSADDVVLNIFKTNHEAFQGLETEVVGADITVDGSKKDEKTEQSLHKTIFDKMDINKDDNVSRSLNNYFVDANGNKLSKKRSTLQFMPFTRDLEAMLKRDGGGTGFGASDAALTNDIMLFNPQTGEVIKDENGNRMRFKIGNDMSNFDDGGDNEIKKLLEVLKQYNIVPPNINTEYADKE